MGEVGPDYFIAGRIMSFSDPTDKPDCQSSPPHNVPFQDLDDLAGPEPERADPAATPAPPSSPAPPTTPASPVSAIDAPPYASATFGSPDAPLTLKSTPQPYRPAVPIRRRMRIMIGLLVLIMLVAINLAIGSGNLLIEKVISESMEPNLLVGDRLLCDVNGVPDRYSIVILKDPEDAEGKLVKRIIGLPGDRILLRGGSVYVNGELELSDKVTSNVISWRDISVKVPTDQVFLLGDNRNNSVDSLNFGPVAYEEILGVVSFIVWPRGRWGKIEPFKPDPTDEPAPITQPNQ